MPPSTSIEIVRSRRAGLERQLIKLVFSFGEVLRELLQHICALVKGQAAQVLAADIARMGQCLAHVDSAAGRVRDDFAGDGAANIDQNPYLEKSMPADETVKVS